MAVTVTHTFTDAEAAALLALRDFRGLPLDTSVQAATDRHLQHQADFALSLIVTHKREVDAQAYDDLPPADKKAVDDILAKTRK